MLSSEEGELVKNKVIAKKSGMKRNRDNSKRHREAEKKTNIRRIHRLSSLYEQHVASHSPSE